MSETTTITDRQREILEHSLGNTSHYRNYFATHDGGKDFATICELMEMGLMVRGRSMPAEMGGMGYFHVTEAGKALAFPDPNPLRYCPTCDQRRRSAKADSARCSHCRTPFPISEATP